MKNSETPAYRKVRFGEIDTRVPTGPGIYEIHTDTGTPLKVGIAGDLRARLRQHRDSLQTKLKLKQNGSWDRCGDVKSNASILAKHLFFDSSITAMHDLRQEAGRRAFLEEDCYILYVVTETREAAEAIERRFERSGRFRYVRRVLKR